MTHTFLKSRRQRTSIILGLLQNAEPALNNDPIGWSSSGGTFIIGDTLAPPPACLPGSICICNDSIADERRRLPLNGTPPTSGCSGRETERDRAQDARRLLPSPTRKTGSSEGRAASHREALGGSSSAPVFLVLAVCLFIIRGRVFLKCDPSQTVNVEHSRARN